VIAIYLRLYRTARRCGAGRWTAFWESAKIAVDAWADGDDI